MVERELICNFWLFVRREAVSVLVARGLTFGLTGGFVKECVQVVFSPFPFLRQEEWCDDSEQEQARKIRVRDQMLSDVRLVNYLFTGVPSH